MASQKRDFEDWGLELAEGIEKGIDTLTTPVAGFFEFLTDKVIDLTRKDILVKKNIHAPRKGDVIFAQRAIYCHYGIYTGKNKVIHYAKEDHVSWSKIAVEETSMYVFSKGDPVYAVPLPKKTAYLHSPRETVKRARSQLGKTDYNLIFNNCEHFAYWCKVGRYESSQVEDVCERIFNRRFEPLELKDEITLKVIDSMSDYLDEVTENISNLMERLSGD
jgi:hypothetical protein